jgi:hypothetical protein
MRQGDKEEADCHPAELEKSAWDSPFAKPGRREWNRLCVLNPEEGRRRSVWVRDYLVSDWQLSVRGGG